MSPSIPIPPHDAPLSGGSPFPPIADYAFLSDCHTGALVSPAGTVEAVCEPIFAYGETPACWEMLGDDWSCAEASGGEVKVRLRSDLRIGIEGSRARARHTLKEGERRFVALGWAHGLEGPADLEDA